MKKFLSLSILSFFVATHGYAEAWTKDDVIRISENGARDRCVNISGIHCPNSNIFALQSQAITDDAYP